MKLDKLIFAAGILLFLYPTLSDHWNVLHQTQVISQYKEQTEQLDAAAYDRCLEQAREYNKKLGEQGISWNMTKEENREYEEVLGMNRDGMMGYIEIPCINCRLPVYHGTEESVLQVGIGHMKGSSLPVGGENSHCVLSGHRGLPSAQLFSRLDQMEEGDIFCIYVLKEKIYYQVDMIRTVLPEETQMLRITKDQDLCTLVTCTPYGINTHRLLVRGSRIQGAKLSAEYDRDRTEGGIQMRIEEIGKWVIVCVLILLFWGSSRREIHAAELPDTETALRGTEVSLQEKEMPGMAAENPSSERYNFARTTELQNQDTGRYMIEVQYAFADVEIALYQTETQNDVTVQSGKKKPYLTKTTDLRGKAVFSGLPAGHYIIAGESHERNGVKYMPVQTEITVPMSAENAGTKTFVTLKYEKKQLIWEPEEENTILPQTGQLWWPVSILALSGLTLIAAGNLKKQTVNKKRQKKQIINKLQM